MRFKKDKTLAKEMVKVTSRGMNQMIGALRQVDYGDNSEFLKKYIYRLRSKIEESPADPEIIHTERGIGYIIANSTR